MSMMLVHEEHIIGRHVIILHLFFIIFYHPNITNTIQTT
jgi:hypothetical protein